jgi:hypothetical protein
MSQHSKGPMGMGSLACHVVRGLVGMSPGWYGMVWCHDVVWVASYAA